MAGIQFNNPSDVLGMPNQASVGPNYQQPMDGPLAPGTPGNSIIHRRGAITRLDLSGNLTASRTFTFGSQAAEGWLLGDTVFIQLPTHAGGSFTVQVVNNHGDVLCTWGPIVANGGMFIFGASTGPIPAGQTGDFCGAIPGAPPIS